MRKQFNRVLPFVILLSLFIGFNLFIKSVKAGKRSSSSTLKPSISAIEKASQNYSKEIKMAAQEFDLPYEYLMALTVLECGGNNPSGSRFEKHVFDRLSNVRSGQRRRYENIKKETIRDASDAALRNLSTSWGPFQLMGYKCVGLNVNVANIRGERSVYYGVKWINEEYGDYLRKGRFKDAFHLHNTGRKMPRNGKSRTHDPKYVDKGLAYMELFKK